MRESEFSSDTPHSGSGSNRLCVFLSGCGLAGPISHYLAAKNQAQTQQHLVSTPAAEPETLGEVLETGTGTFDPNDPNFKIFNPCTEISKEEYAQLGLEFPFESNMSGDLHAFCILQPTDSADNRFVFSVSVEAFAPEQVDYYAELVSEPVIPLPEHWYQQKNSRHNDNEDLENTCRIVVPTNRGRIVFSSLVSHISSELTPQGICQKSVDTLQKIFALQR